MLYAKKLLEMIINVPTHGPLQLLCGTALALLPHLHGLDRHSALVTLAPSREPLLGGVVESPSGVGSIVQPRLVADLVPVFSLASIFECEKIAARLTRTIRWCHRQQR